MTDAIVYAKNPVRIEKWDSVFWSIKLCSEDPDSDYSQDHKTRLELHFWKFYVVIPLFFRLKPYAQWVDMSRHQGRKPGDGFYQQFRREWGFTCFEGHVSLCYGEQTHDSITDKRKGFFLPWHGRTLVEHKVTSPTQSFIVADFDNEIVTAKVYTEFYSHRVGEGFWKFLGYLVPKMVNHRVDIEFSSEVGNRKGSWKGGTLGHSCPTQKDFSPHQALALYCVDHRMQILSGPF